MNRDNVIGKTNMVKGATVYLWGKLLNFTLVKLKGILVLLRGYSRNELGNTKTSLKRIKQIGQAELKRREYARRIH